MSATTSPPPLPDTSVVAPAGVETTDNGLHFVPSSFFFVERVPLPPDLREAEHADFAELTLESLSPFPLRDLYCGAWADSASGTLLVYGGLRRRIDPWLGEVREQARFILPGFLPACLLASTAALKQLTFVPFASASKSFEAGDSDLSEGLPRLLLHSPEGAPAPLPDLLGNALPRASEVLPAFCLHRWPLLSEKEVLEFHFEAIGSPSIDPQPAHTARLSPAELWLADIRDPGFKAAERGRRRRDAMALYGFGLIGILAVLLLFGQIGLWFTARHVDRLAVHREAQRSAVAGIQDRSDLLATLEQIAQAELRPLDVLEALNVVRMELAGNRAPGLHFTEVRAEPINRVTIEGVASTVNDLNRYTQALLASGRFRIISEPRTLVRGGRTTFTLTVDYVGSFPVLTGAAVSPSQID